MASGRSFIYNTKSTGIKFQPDKCKTMRIGRSKVEKHEYTLKADLKPMEETIPEKDAGVTIDKSESPGISFVALLCIFSIISMCFLRCGFAYSR
jgi:hypothetical protein